MEWRKVKNIIILVLLLVNGFLLVIVGARLGEVRRYEQSAMDQACRVLEGNGIRVEQAGLKAAEDLFVLDGERSTEGEATVAAALLGSAVTGQNRGGGLYTYETDAGAVSIRSGGQITLRPAENDRWKAADPEQFALQLFREMGLEGRVTASDSDSVTLCQLREGVPLFSCQTVFSFEGGRLVSLTGTVIAAELEGGEKASLMDLPTALLRFQDGILSGGDICSAVVSMEPGYRLTRSFSSMLRLEPVWLVSTNAADYYLDAVTGELSRLT